MRRRPFFPNSNNMSSREAQTLATKLAAISKGLTMRIDAEEQRLAGDTPEFRKASALFVDCVVDQFEYMYMLQSGKDFEALAAWTGMVRRLKAVLAMYKAIDSAPAAH